MDILIKFGVGFVIGYLTYVYRYQFMFWAFRAAVLFVDVYIRLKSKWYGQGSDITYMTSVSPNEHVTIHNYKLWLSEKTRTVHVISNIGDKIDVQHVIKDVSNNMKLRNKIVHCSISDKEDTFMIDLTSTFREFVYHFDKNDFKVKYLFDYISHKNDFPILDEYILTVYMNDEIFTEYKYPISKASTMWFHEILYPTTE